jgi:hypothetical protein
LQHNRYRLIALSHHSPDSSCYYSLKTFLLTKKEISRSLILVSVLYLNSLGYDEMTWLRFIYVDHNILPPTSSFTLTSMISNLSGRWIAAYNLW